MGFARNTVPESRELPLGAGALDSTMTGLSRLIGKSPR